MVYNAILKIKGEDGVTPLYNLTRVYDDIHVASFDSKDNYITVFNHPTY